MTRFLAEKDYKNLSWLHYLRYNDLPNASITLVHVASDEVKSVSSKKTLFSIGKLSLLASAPSLYLEVPSNPLKADEETYNRDLLQDFDANLSIIGMQEQVNIVERK